MYNIIYVCMYELLRIWSKERALDKNQINVGKLRLLTL